jgi:microcystin-dependent protein
MSTVKVNEVKHLSNTGTANIRLESNATTNLQATSTLGLNVVGTLTVSGVSTLNGNTVIGNASSDTMVLTSTVSGFNNFSGFTGEMRMYAGNAAGDAPPAGWLYCNGDTISNTIDDGGVNAGGTHYNADGKGNDYQPLFNLLKAASDWGNTSSASWGTDKVKLPDLRSRSPVGIATGAANAADARSTGIALAAGLTSRTLGDVVGTETHPLTVAELAVHTHATVVTGYASTGTTISNPTHIHNMSSHTHAVSGTTNTEAAHSHGFSYVDGAYSNADDTYNALMIGNRNVARISDYQAAIHSAGAHSHTWSDTSDAPSNNNTSATAPGQVLTDPTHRHSFAQANAEHSGVSAAGTAHTILSPIIAVNYIIKV